MNAQVLVLWADNRSANLGVRALARGMSEFARMAWGTDTNVDFQDFKGFESDVAFNKATLLRDALLPGSPIGRKVDRYDVVLILGAGDSFTDIYGLRRMAAIMYTQSRVLRSRAALVLGPQTIGPFATRIGRAGAARVLGRADAVLTRDPVSSSFATSLGRRPDGQATDVVFALPKPDVGVGQRDVVVNVSGLLWASDAHVNARAHREGVVEFCRSLQQRGREVTLLAHVLSNASSDNDVPAIEDVARVLSRPVEMIVPGSLDEARAVVGSASTVVGARMHACLNGLSMGVPTVAWSYSRKFAPLLEALGWPYYVDVRKEADLARRTHAALEQAESAVTATISDMTSRAADEDRRSVRPAQRVRSIDDGAIPGGLGMAVGIDAAGALIGVPVATKQVRVATASGWAARYARRLWLSDTVVVVVVVAVSVAHVVRFDVDGFPRVSGKFSPSYLTVSVVLLAAWLAMLAGGRSRDRRLVGSGPGEYSRVFGLTWRLFAGVAIIAYMLRMEIGRGYLAIVAPLGLGLLLLERFWWRQWLHGRRMDGDYQSGILVIGHRGKALRLIETFHRNSRAGYVVIGVCVPEGELNLTETVGGVPIIGSIEDAGEIAQRIGADAVAVTGSDAITAEAVRRLGWDLEGTGIDLAVAVALTDVAGPRVLMRPVNGLPLMYVDEPHFTGLKFVAKSVFDWVGAACIAILLSPALLALAVAVTTTSRGPVLYTQERVGRDGRHFRMIKFRSMVTGAHDHLAEVLALEGVESVGMFYKPKNDPRVTPVGRFIRKYSLDELPQLFNVLRGDMSLVGPRPQIDNEVVQYDRTAHRRLLVKPGLTGLWQVSGRSDLSIEDGIRMDVYYVENWSLFGDMLILARTAKTILAAHGAY